MELGKSRGNEVFFIVSAFLAFCWLFTRCSEGQKSPLAVKVVEVSILPPPPDQSNLEIKAVIHIENATNLTIELSKISTVFLVDDRAYSSSTHIWTTQYAPEGGILTFYHEDTTVSQVSDVPIEKNFIVPTKASLTLTCQTGAVDFINIPMKESKWVKLSLYDSHQQIFRNQLQSVQTL